MPLRELFAPGQSARQEKNGEENGEESVEHSEESAEEQRTEPTRKRQNESASTSDASLAKRRPKTNASIVAKSAQPRDVSSRETSPQPQPSAQAANPYQHYATMTGMAQYAAAASAIYASHAAQAQGAPYQTGMIMMLPTATGMPLAAVPTTSSRTTPQPQPSSSKSSSTSSSQSSSVHSSGARAPNQQESNSGSSTGVAMNTSSSDTLNTLMLFNASNTTVNQANTNSNTTSPTTTLLVHDHGNTTTHEPNESTDEEPSQQISEAASILGLMNNTQSEETQGEPTPLEQLLVDLIPLYHQLPTNELKHKLVSSIIKSVPHMTLKKVDKTIPWFPCTHPGCYNLYQSGPSLSRHMFMHTGERPFKCTHEGCDKSYATRDRLAEHMHSHTNTRPYVCTHPGCDKAYNDKKSLRNHMLTHGERKFECPAPGCDKKFFRKTHLDQHFRTHTGEGRGKNGKQKYYNDDEEIRANGSALTNGKSSRTGMSSSSSSSTSLPGMDMSMMHGLSGMGFDPMTLRSLSESPVSVLQSNQSGQTTSAPTAPNTSAETAGSPIMTFVAPQPFLSTGQSSQMQSSQMQSYTWFPGVERT